MASLYKRDKIWWIRYKKDGKWCGASTGYRVDNAGESMQARILARARSQEEIETNPESPAWSNWVPSWMNAKWGGYKSTLSTYRRFWRHLYRWLHDEEWNGRAIARPHMLKYQDCQRYPEWRLRNRGGRNSAILELRLLGQVMEEALRRSYIDTNPARRLGIARQMTSPKLAWTDHQIQTVAKVLEEEGWGSWMHVTFLLGLYQACRLRQSQLPIECIDLKRDCIYYPFEKVKGGKFFAQPIDPRIRETLVQIVSKRIKEGYTHLCDIPDFPSVEWRNFLNGLGFHNIVHHGLRVTWCTRACLAGVPMSQAMRFANHASSEVHRIYQQFSVVDLAAVPALLSLPSLPQAHAEHTTP